MSQEITGACFSIHGDGRMPTLVHGRYPYPYCLGQDLFNWNGKTTSLEINLEMPAWQFQILFCDRFECPPSEYEERALRELLYSHARLVVPIIRKMRPDFFNQDFKFIRYLGTADDFQE